MIEIIKLIFVFLLGLIVARIICGSPKKAFQKMMENAVGGMKW